MTTSTINNLSGIINIQKQSLDDVSRIYYPDTSNITSQISGLNNSLNSTYQNIDKIKGSVDNAISKQDDVLNVVQTESTRLAQKKQNVDNARDGQKRLILLNDSYRKRYLQYIKIIMILIVVLAIFGALKMLESNFSFVPSVIYEFLIVIDIAIGIIYIYTIYNDIRQHDLIEYDKLIIESPVTNKSTTYGSSSNNLLKPLKSCNDQNCCSEGTTWDEATAKCKPTPVDTTETFVSNSPNETNGYNFL